MSQAKIVWFSESGKPLKVFSLRKWVITLFLGVSLLLLILSLVLVFLNRIYLHRMEAAQSENVKLNRRIAEQKEQIHSLKQSVASQNKSLAEFKSKLEKSEKELQEIREMEIKLRRFLDLEHKQSLSEKHSHQGGFQTDGDMDSVEIPMDNATSKVDNAEVVSYSLRLKQSLREVMRSLEEKRERLHRTPSILPVKGEDVWLSCDFGRRTNPMTGRKEFHSGVDVAGGYKTPIISPAKGEVTRIVKDRILGNTIRIRHRKDMRTTYGHLHSIAVKEGEHVERGQVVGYMGNTGRSTGTHVHYEIVKNGKAMDPMNYILDREGETLSLR